HRVAPVQDIAGAVSAVLNAARQSKPTSDQSDNGQTPGRDPPVATSDVILHPRAHTGPSTESGAVARLARLGFDRNRRGLGESSGPGYASAGSSRSRAANSTNQSRATGLASESRRAARWAGVTLRIGFT